MKEQFEDFIYSRVKKPVEQEVQEILSIFEEEHLEKGMQFKEGHTIIKKLGFLIEGSARNFFINDKGDEITFEIVKNSNFISDMISVRTGEKSPVTIEMVENSSVLIAQMADVWNLLETNLTFNILIREHIGDRSMELIKKYHLFLNGSAKKRYQYILETNPVILKKFPLKYIASMIGVSQTQLSRIRGEKK